MVRRENHFASYTPGTEIILSNSAVVPLPGDPAETVAPNVMKFIVTAPARSLHGHPLDAHPPRAVASAGSSGLHHREQCHPAHRGAHPAQSREAGWKATVQTHPGQITRVIPKFETLSGSFPYHCHILEHEDHEMMRQYNLLCTAPSVQTQPAAARTCQGGTLSIATGSYHNTGSYDCLITNPGGEATTIGVFLRFCLSDFNCNGAATVQNIFDFLAGFFASDPRADAHRNGAVTVQDIFDFLSSFFAGCASALVRPTLASFRMIPAGFP